MNWIENLLILVGISLDIFAGMECQGSLVAKIDKKHLTLVCGLIAIWQLAALYIGNVLAGLLYINDLARNERFIGTVIAAVIFFCLGVRLIVKAIKNERVNEHREENLGFKRFWRMAAVTSIYTLLTGIAFGFLVIVLLHLLSLLPIPWLPVGASSLLRLRIEGTGGTSLPVTTTVELVVCNLILLTWIWYYGARYLFGKVEVKR